MTPVFMKKDGESNNRYGLFKHNDMIGKEFGSKVSKIE
jgi:tRNA A58 N-methylase Trm61